MRIGLFLSALAVSGVLHAGPIPVSSCTLNGATFVNGLTCGLYPSNAGGNFSGDVTVNLPGPSAPAAFALTPGYLVLDSQPASIVADGNGLTSDPNQANWTQVLFFKPMVPNGPALSLELFTVGCGTGNLTDRSCFPTYATIFSQSVGTYDFEAAPAVGGVFNFPCLPSGTCGAAQGIVDYYNIHYILPTPAVPEPSTMMIAASGLAVLGGFRRWKSLK